MKTFVELEQYAQDNFIPIARKDVVAYLINTIKENNFKNILEIGTAIGYTTISLALINKDIKITTLEIDNQRIEVALQNFVDFKVNEQIRIIKEDARYFYPDLHYDLIFLDASKKSNVNFFEKFKEYLTNEGIIIIDNLKLDDLPGEVPLKKKETFQKINKELISYLKKQKDYQISFLYHLGDGLVVSKKIIK